MILGLSYQFMDDVADVVADVAEVGKQSGNDAGKITSIDMFDLDGARAMSREFREKGLSALDRFGLQSDWLRTLVDEVSWESC